MSLKSLLTSSSSEWPSIYLTPDMMAMDSSSTSGACTSSISTSGATCTSSISTSWDKTWGASSAAMS